MVERGYCIYSISLNILTYFLHLNNYLVTLFHNTICRAQLFCPFLLSASEYLSNMLFSYHLLYFCTALSLIIMLSSHYHHHKSKTFSQLTSCLLLCPPHLGWTYYFCFFRRLPFAVRRRTWFPDILGNSSYPIFTKFGMQVYWVNSLYGIAFGDDSSIAN